MTILLSNISLTLYPLCNVITSTFLSYINTCYIVGCHQIRINFTLMSSSSTRAYTIISVWICTAMTNYSKMLAKWILLHFSDMTDVPIAGHGVRSMVPLIIFCFTSSSGALPEYAVTAIWQFISVQ